MSYIKYISFIIILALIACAPQKVIEQQSLYHQFNTYRQLVGSSSNDAFLLMEAKQYFSNDYWGRKSDGITKSEEDKVLFINRMLKFTNVMPDVSSSLETIAGTSGCLLVMGKSSDNTPTDFYIKYSKRGDDWLFDEITIKYFLDGTKRFLKSAVCDEDKQNQLWLEFMQNQHK